MICRVEMAADRGMDATAQRLWSALAWSWREIMNAIFYIMRTGCPGGFCGRVAWQTVYVGCGLCDGGLLSGSIMRW